MKHVNQSGSINVLVIPLILLVLFFLGAAGFGFWAFSSRQDYKDNTDKKIAAAQEVTRQEVQVVDAKKYAEEAKNPLVKYSGPSAFGSISAQYPKTWSAYVSQNNGADPAVDAYFNPGYVPNIAQLDTAFALRIQVTSLSYDQVISQFSTAIAAHTVTLAPYTLPKVPNIVGTIIKGKLDETKTGTMVIMPLRNMALKIWTLSPNYQADFDTNVLPNFTFSP